MRRPLLAVATAMALISLVLTTTPAAAAPTARYNHLDPGGPARLEEKVPVNVVLIGYERKTVDVRALRQGLAPSYEPVVRSRGWYGQVEKLGITYRYDYRVRFAGRRYDDRFFRQLRKLGRSAPLTEFQQAYNDQAENTLTVRNNLEIPAPTVEKWLADHPPEGVDTRGNTIYLINWYGRKDFKFHVYTKQDEPDPDTGFNFGKELASRRLVAWGGTTARDEESGLGTTRRVWFHDISAGPELWAGSWNVDDADLDGDDVADYRIPPAWEYGHYRPAAALTGDLAKLVRYVALDLLFTSSPIYPVELPTPEPPRTVNLDSNTYEGIPGVDASAAYIKPELLVDELQELTRAQRLDYDNQDLPYTGQARRCYELLLEDVSCAPGAGFPPIANLYLQNTADLARTKDDGDTVDYELPIFNYAVDAPTPGLGFADDNYVDGTQSYVFNFISPEIVDSGYGLTTTIIHEVGHHLGLSHPHDGYDSGSGRDFEPTGDLFFTWAGDEVNSMMSYIDLNWDFSQFDQDNLARFQSAALVEGANRLAGESLAAAHPGRAMAELRAADRRTGLAERAFARHDYAGALGWAGRAYALARAGAEDAGVDVDASEQRAKRARGADARAAAVHTSGEFIDSLDGPRGQ